MPGRALSVTYQGQPVIHKTASSEFHYAVVAGNITNGGATADLLTFENGNQWYTGNDIITTAIAHAAVDQGSGTSQWQPIAAPGLPDLSPSSPSRSLGTAFQPSATRPTFVSYSGRIVSQITLSGGQSGRIELRSDASNPPTTVRARVAGGATGTVVAGVSQSDTAEAPLSYIVPAGHFVLLQSVNETSTPTYSIGAQVEIVL